MHVQTMDTQEPSRLVERARGGDRDAFGELYREHHAAVFRLARFSLPPAAAEDAVAETFLRAWAAIGRYKDTGAPFRAWLYGIAKNVVAESHRNAKRIEPRSEPPDATVRFDQRETDRLALAAAVEKLPTDQRYVIELKYLVGLGNPDVSRALGKSVGAVNALQWRALETLKRLMADR